MIDGEEHARQIDDTRETDGGRSDRPRSLWVVIGLLALLGIRGLAGGAAFLVDPSGGVVGVPTEVLTPLPIDDFMLPGLVLFVGLGLLPLASAYGLYTNRRWAWHVAVSVGILLCAWAVAEGFLLGFGARLQGLNMLQALVLLLVSLAPGAREHCRASSG